MRPLPPELQATWDRAEANPGTKVEVGRSVVCDGCSEDLTDSDQVGGIIVGSYAYCLDCTARLADAIAADRRQHPEAVIDPSPDETFADFVRRTRAESGQNYVQVIR